MVITTDQQIHSYIQEKKIIPLSFKPVLRDKKYHYEFQQEIIGEQGSVFKIIVRQNKNNPLDFSVIFGVMNSGKLFRIKRYNGNQHEHTNKIEKTELEGFHIHKATQKYQENGFEEEGYAEKTTRYNDWNTALKVMLKENNFELAVERGQRRL